MISKKSIGIIWTVLALVWIILANEFNESNYIYLAIGSILAAILAFALHRSKIDKEE